MKRISKTSLLMVFFTLWFSVTTLVWGCSPAILQRSGNTYQAIIAQILHLIMLSGIDVLIMLLGHNIIKQDHELNVGEIFAKITKYWLLLIITSVFATLVVLFFNHFKINELYSALFPILHDEVPIVTGLLISLFFLPIWVSLKPLYQTFLMYLGLGILWLPFIFGIDMFAFNNQQNPLLFTLLFYLGSGITNHKTKGSHLRSILICWLVAFMLVSLMPYISYMNHSDLSVADRFTNIANPLIVLATYYFIHSIGQKNEYVPDTVIQTIFISLILINVPAVNSLLTEVAVDTVGHSFVKLVLISSAFSLGLLAISYIFAMVIKHIAEHYKTIKNINGIFIGLKQLEDIPLWLAKVKKKLILQIQQKKEFIIVALVSYVLSVFSILLMNIEWVSHVLPANYNIVMFTMFRRQPLVILNAVIIFSLTMWLWAALRRYYVALITSTCLISIWTIANRLKILARNEPIMPSELKMVKVWGSLISMAGWQILLIAAVSLLVALSVAIFLEVKYKTRGLGRKDTLCWLLVLPLILISSLWWNTGDTIPNTFMRGADNDPQFFNQLYGVQSNGPLVQFLNNIDVDVMKKPTGYSKETMIKIRNKYMSNAVQINKTRNNKLNDQTIIFNLSESFADPRRVPGVSIKKNPISNIDEIKDNSTSGLMISSGYGGGTANMEYMTLTGFAMSNFLPTLATPYTQLVNTLPHDPTILGSFPYSAAIHPYFGSFYSRNSVFKKFGFNKFYTLDSKKDKIRHKEKIEKSPYMSDKTSYANVLDQINRAHSGQFIQLSTMQNHLPYSEDYYRHDSSFVLKVNSDTKKDSLEDYVQGIHYSDMAVKGFIEQINKIQKPITIVFYGDHLPGSIYGNSLEKNGLLLHETDYFVYSNEYAREHGALQKLSKDTNYVDPNDFIAMVAEQTNSKVNWYQAMLTDVYHKLPAFAVNTGQHTKVPGNSGRTQFINNEGKFTNPKKWNKQQKQLWHDYQLVQYDVTAGKQYLVRDGQLK